MVCVLDGFAAPALVPVGVAIVAHETTHIVGAVLRRRSRLAELTNCAGAEIICVKTEEGAERSKTS